MGDSLRGNQISPFGSDEPTLAGFVDSEDVEEPTLASFVHSDPTIETSEILAASSDPPVALFEDHPRQSTRKTEDENFGSESSDGECDDEGDDREQGDEPPLSLEELLYSASSYHAIVRPVSATMILAALASVFINDDESRELGEEQFASAYNVWQVDKSGNVGKNLLASVGNTFIMVLAIGSMTFGIVLLYKYR